MPCQPHQAGQQEMQRTPAASILSGPALCKALPARPYAGLLSHLRGHAPVVSAAPLQTCCHRAPVLQSSADWQTLLLLNEMTWGPMLVPLPMQVSCRALRDELFETIISIIFSTSSTTVCAIPPPTITTTAKISMSMRGGQTWRQARAGPAPWAAGRRCWPQPAGPAAKGHSAGKSAAVWSGRATACPRSPACLQAHGCQ